jgi:two-component system, NtrC family, response regulator AtoC
LDLEVLANTPPGAPAAVEGGFHVAGPPVAMEELERRYARHVLEQMGGRRMEAARALGISYPTFLKRIGAEEE